MRGGGGHVLCYFQHYMVWGGGGVVMFFSHFMLFPTCQEKKYLGIQNNYFSFNVFFVFFLYAGNIEKCPFTYSYYPLFPSCDFFISIGGGGFLASEPVRGRSRATELPCCTYVSSVMRSSGHFNTSGFPRTPQKLERS